MRYFSLLFTPAEQREYLAAIYVIESELRDSALAGHDVAHVRLQWWREEIGRLVESRPQHPATQVLASSRHAVGMDFNILQETVLAAAMDLAGATFETDAELDRYFRRSCGALFEIAARRLSDGPLSEQALLAVNQCARLVRQTETLRDLRHDAVRGRLYLPLAALDETGVTHQAIAQAEWPEAFVQWLQTRSHRQSIEFSAAVDALLQSERSALRPLIVLAHLHVRLREKMTRDRFARSRVKEELPAFDKLWTAWRAARAAR